MKFTTKIFIFIFASVSYSSNGARIFGAFPTPSISHQVVYRALMEELAKRGHELVVLTTDPVHYKQSEFANFTEIDVHDLSYEAWRNKFHFVEDTIIQKPSTLKILDDYYDVMLSLSEKQLSHPKIQQMIKKQEKFDLCFVEGCFRMYVAFKDIFNCSLIQFNSFSGIASDYDNVGSPSHPIYYFDMFNRYHLNEMNFWRRLELLKQRMDYYYIMEQKYKAVYRELSMKMFGPNIRTLGEIESEVDMIFQNYHPIISGVRPLVPAVVHLGSMHIKPPKPLPSNIQKVLDDAKNGAIYLSFGSNARSADLPADRLNQIINALKSLPYTVLWKWETEDLPNKPKNVFISKWYPQQSILANRPDIVLVGHSKNTTYIVDVTIPHDENLQKAERDKILKYMDLAHEIKDMWRTPATIVVPIVISTNGLIPKSLHANLCKVGVDGGLKYLMQKAVLLSTCRTLPHPNVKLFITQGGQQSMEEAIHSGVPMIGVPFLADQFGNVARMVDLGIGKKFLIEDVTEKNLKQAILDVTSNKSYYDNVRTLRDLIYDQPQTPMERAVWWTEYIIRHKGAKHLRSPTAGMSSWEYYLVWDLAIVFAFCVSVIILAILIINYVVKTLTVSQKLKKQ